MGRKQAVRAKFQTVLGMRSLPAFPTTVKAASLLQRVTGSDNMVIVNQMPVASQGGR